MASSDGVFTEGLVAHLNQREKRSYLLALITMASSDDEVLEVELNFIKMRAKALSCELKKRDLRMYNLKKVVETIRGPNVRAALFQDLVIMGGADRVWRPEELKILRYFSEKWAQPLPERPFMNVQWDDVDQPTDVQVEDTSVRMRMALGTTRNKRLLESAHPGSRWGWILAGSVMYVGLLILLSFLVVAFSDDFESSDISIRFLTPFAFGIVSGSVIGFLCPFRTMREPVISVSIPFAVMAFFLYAAVVTGGGGGLLTGLSVILSSILLPIHYGFTVLGVFIGISLKDRFITD